MRWFLKDIDTDDVYEIFDGLTLGRTNGNHTFPQYRKMSGTHLQFFIENGNPFLIDLQSKNGTYVNSQECETNKRIPLSEDSIICFGDKSFILKKNQVKTSTIELQKKRSA